MKEDFLRVQKMIKKRQEKESKVEENLKLSRDDKKYKANLLNEKG